MKSVIKLIKKKSKIPYYSKKLKKCKKQKNKKIKKTITNQFNP